MPQIQFEPDQKIQFEPDQPFVQPPKLQPPIKVVGEPFPTQQFLGGLNRLAFGPSEAESRANVYKRDPEIAAEIEKRGGKFAPVTGMEETSILPKFQQPETYLGGFLNKLYEDFPRQWLSGPGMLGSAGIRPIPRINPQSVEEAVNLTKQSRKMVGLDIPERLELGTGKTRFVSGSEGTIDLGETPKQAPKVEVKPPEVAPQVKSFERPIATNTPVKKATLQWANGRYGARIRGNTLSQEFADLSDPALVDSFESGSREGRLADVQKYFDERWQQARNLGFLKEDQKRLNYLRHYFTQSPDEISEATRNYIAQNPQFAKTGKIPTYAAGEQAGLTRKFQTIPEIMGAYETEFHQAVRNKEFYDYLKKSGQLEKGAISTNPTEWTFRGPRAKELATYVKNIYSQSPEWLSNTADLVRYTKNLYLGSGIPKTPLNMHYYNTLKSKWYAQGSSAIGDYLGGTFNPSRDVDYLKSKRDFIADLVDHGMGFEDIEDHNALLNQARNDSQNFVSKTAYAVRDFQSRMFEDPLFKIRLPAAKVELADRVYKAELPKVGNEAALDLAAEISNDFLGGINKVLRNKTTKDLTSIGLLAPDWLESRMNLGIKGIQALVGKQNPIYAKAMARKALLRGGAAGATYALTGDLTNPSRRSSLATTIPLGKTDTGLTRNLQSFGTTAEEFRFPEELAAAYSNPKETFGEKVGDLVSNRLSLPLKSVMDLALHRNTFGDPLFRTRYGKPISTEQKYMNVGREVTRPFVPPWSQSLYQILLDQDPDIERAISQGLELPIQYNRVR